MRSTNLGRSFHALQTQQLMSGKWRTAPYNLQQRRLRIPCQKRSISFKSQLNSTSRKTFTCFQRSSVEILLKPLQYLRTPITSVHISHAAGFGLLPESTDHICLSPARQFFSFFSFSCSFFLSIKHDSQDQFFLLSRETGELPHTALQVEHAPDIR